MNTVDPETLFVKLTQGKVQPRKAKCLAIIHEICKQRFNARATDWTVASIGRESEARGGIGPNGLRLPRSEAYRGLIAAWKEHADAANPAAKRKVTAGADDWILAIDNVASRQLVFCLQSELAAALDEVKLLKKLLPNNGVIKVLPGPAGQTPSEAASVPVTAAAERACKRFVDGPLSSPARAAEVGFKLRKDGDLALASTGEVVLERAALELLRNAAKIG